MANAQTTQISQEQLQSTLFAGGLSHVISTVYQNERPPCGLTGVFDWYLQGQISSCLRKGAFSGKQGECVYFPFSRDERTFHLLLVGGGASPAPGKRVSLCSDSFSKLRQNLIQLKLQQIGLSLSDLGYTDPAEIQKHLQGVALWIAP